MPVRPNARRGLDARTPDDMTAHVVRGAVRGAAGAVVGFADYEFAVTAAQVLFRFLDYRTAYQLRPFLAQYGLLIIVLAFLVPILPSGQSVGGAVIFPILDGITRLLVGR